MNTAEQVVFERAIGLEEAAELLGMHPDVLRREARAGRIPGMKQGRWKFLPSLLAEWQKMRMLENVVEEVEGGAGCRSTRSKTRTGLTPTISTSQSRVSRDCEKALGLKTLTRTANV